MPFGGGGGGAGLTLVGGGGFRVNPSFPGVRVDDDGTGGVVLLFILVPYLLPFEGGGGGGAGLIALGGDGGFFPLSIGVGLVG
ncbi:TPA: hypothetical protein ACLFOS_000915 [Yersinia enterocolitica]|uniref:hypothetical protein n=1 Tax=Yersinia enterocolitica TaxID=630 RepID=UPI0012B17F9F|nr:hypothetical protein [Yersinia enterocolitica]HEI6771189.1 hypothetical protein [Yersinia enterocolitica]HEI6888851.1 hypothetical protein [Yersinia enterocolitica]HEI6893093.1 hypothetical protein [Yersinia enterocolitica]